MLTFALNIEQYCKPEHWRISATVGLLENLVTVTLALNRARYDSVSLEPVALRSCDL